MKLWQKDKDSLSAITRFTSGDDRTLDLSLARFDVLGSLAHIKMLESVGLLSTEELKLLSRELKNIYKEIEAGGFGIDEGVEDVHSQVELHLTRHLGDAGKKIHSGRSRNDQVLLDLKLFMREEIRIITLSIKNLFDLLMGKSEEHKEKLLPGYTHFQPAMPSSFGLWFGAYAESLSDDLIPLQAAYRFTNMNPLGSAAGFGSSFPLNRQLTTSLLGFEDLHYNVVNAQMGRGKTEKIVAQALANIAATLSKLASDAIWYMNPDFGFISFPDELTTGSSIMPHKKNPDVWELIRAKCNGLQAMPNEISLITNNLPSGYHRDLQVTKEKIIPAFNILTDCLRMSSLMTINIRVRDNILDEGKYKILFSVEEVNKLVLGGMPFRDAYKKVGQQIEQGKFSYSGKLHHSHEGSMGNLCNDRIRERFENTLGSFEFDKALMAMDSLLI